MTDFITPCLTTFAPVSWGGNVKNWQHDALSYCETHKEY